MQVLRLCDADAAGCRVVGRVSPGGGAAVWSWRRGDEYVVVGAELGEEFVAAFVDEFAGEAGAAL
jgi:hypothetical protein